MSLPRIVPRTEPREPLAVEAMPKAAAASRERGSVMNPWPGPAGAFPALCPLCGGALEPMPGMPGRARHRSTRNSARCVLTTRRYQPDELVVRGSGDAALAARSRARFVEHWEWHYTLARRVWPGFTLNRFMTLTALSDLLGLWSYPALRDEDLSAVLLVMAGFMRSPAPGDATGPAPGGEARWGRFWFEAAVRDVGDLWRGPGAAPRLFLVHYREPLATPFPTGAQVSGWHRVDGMREAWFDALAAAAPRVPDPERAAFRRFLAARDGAN
ncbi:hypothetical protein F3J11_31960 [Burkholderia sp. Cy-647]|uniref:hypothetical protein n=3 Tax=Burkholderia TaxID=32008 RepID=UPI00046A4D40|nr:MULTISPECIES: hypothetical protein [unclassified Burkholderia]NIF67242.1 hypothetical protein [Burkholderia sp. Cy-647]